MNRLISSILILVMALTFLPIYNASASNGFSGGDGSEGNPYLVETEEQLAMINDYPTYNFKLKKDITLQSEWVPFDIYDAFSGSLDGNGFKISRLKTTNSFSYSGLFSVNNGRISNLGIEIANDGQVSATIYAGGLVGYNRGEINNCYVIGNVSSDKYAGGLVGYNKGAITNCYTNSSVSAKLSDIYVGGLVGYNESATIINCYSTGNVLGTPSSYTSLSSKAGGLIGDNVNGRISNCYSTCDVTVSSSESGLFVGGLIGRSNGSIISNSYASGDISSSSYRSFAYSGGLIGHNGNDTIQNCYANGKVSASSSSSSSPYYSAFSGGLVGSNDSGLISNCFATGSILASSSTSSSYPYFFAYGGGLVGVTWSGKIINCYAMGDILSLASSNACAYAGGAIGFNSSAEISNCYSIGFVSANNTNSAYSGGFIGKIENLNTLTDCFYNIETSGCSDIGKGMPKTALEMKQISTYSNWAINTVWKMSSEINDGYPYLLDLRPNIELLNINIVSNSYFDDENFTMSISIDNSESVVGKKLIGTIIDSNGELVLIEIFDVTNSKQLYERVFTDANLANGSYTQNIMIWSGFEERIPICSKKSNQIIKL